MQLKPFNNFSHFNHSFFFSPLLSCFSAFFLYLSYAYPPTILSFSEMPFITECLHFGRKSMKEMRNKSQKHWTKNQKDFFKIILYKCVHCEKNLEKYAYNSMCVRGFVCIVCISPTPLLQAGHDTRSNF